MTKCEIFLNFFNEITKDMTLPDEVKEFYNMLSSSKDKFESNKPAFTENGIAIIKYLQSIDTSKPLKSKEIADGICYIIEHPEKRCEMESKAYDRYIQMFSFDAFAEKYLNFCKSL